MTRNEYRAVIEARRAELSALTGTRNEIAVERLSDPIDEVQRMSERELAISSLNRNWAALRAIDEALERLQDGSFGVCQNCEEAISEKRLRAAPWAALCLRCQEIADGETAGSLPMELAA